MEEMVNIQASRIPVLMGGKNEFQVTPANTEPDGTGRPMVALVIHSDVEGVRAVLALSTDEARAHACSIIAMATNLDAAAARARVSPILIPS